MRQMIKDLREGDVVNDFYVVQQCEKRESKFNKVFLTLTLADASGSVAAAVWDDAERLAKIFEPGHVVKVTGKVGVYEGKPQIKVSDGRAAKPGDDFKESDMRPSTPYDIEKMWMELEGYRKSVQDPYVGKLLAFFFEDPEFAKEFKVHTAAKAMHHAYCGGLLEHTLGVTRLVLSMAECYPKMSRDLLVAGAMLHDIGKIFEMGGLLSTEYTTLGRLIGHISYASELVGKACDKIEGFPSELRLQLQHLILSHHGKLEFGSPVVPQTPEAMALFRADEFDAHFYMAFRAISEEKDQSGDFTSRVKALETALFKTEKARFGEAYSMAFPGDYIDRSITTVSFDKPELPAEEKPAPEVPSEETAAKQGDLF
ncbi:HD domain-containing protein [bacterium]|nr:HD domain-containing protein [bacterium]